MKDKKEAKDLMEMAYEDENGDMVIAEMTQDELDAVEDLHEDDKKKLKPGKK